MAEKAPMQLAAMLFTLAALGGGALAAIRISGQPRPPTWMALGHGAIAAAALVTLAYAAATTTLPALAQIALGVFVLAALGGATIFGAFHLRAKPLPIPLIVGHGAIAIAGLVLLLMAVFQ
jgi:hypothetical protein